MKLVLLIIAGIWITACQTVPYQGQAREVVKKPQVEGVVALPINYRDEDQAKAQTRMSANCQPGSYKVIEEGEAVIGQEVKTAGKETDRASTKKEAGKLFGIPLMTGEEGGKNSESSQVTTAVKEWQIKYKCVAEGGGGKQKRGS